jgi:hypothetical protein
MEIVCRRFPQISRPARALAGLTALLAAGCADRSARRADDAPPTGAVTALSAPSRTTVEVSGPRVLVNGTPRTLLGFRVGSAPLRDDWTNALIGELDLWKSHGINSLILWLQGTSGGATRFFSDDGTRVGEEEAPIVVKSGYGLPDMKQRQAELGTTSGRAILARTSRIVDEADRRGMVVFVGIVYSSSIRSTDSVERLAQGMAAAAAPFRDRKNVILAIWNEAHSDRPLETPEAMAKYVQALDGVAPGRPRCIGARNSSSNQGYAAVAGLHLVCQDEGSDAPALLAEMESLRALGKPVVNIETFAGRGGGYLDDPSRTANAPAGYHVDFSVKGGFRRVYGALRDDVYEDGVGRRLAGRNDYRAVIARAGADPARQLHLMIHVAGWFQGASRTEGPAQLGEIGTPGKWNNVFAAGHGRADGSIEAPGIRWILEAVAATGATAAAQGR